MRIGFGLVLVAGLGVTTGQAFAAAQSCQDLVAQFEARRASLEAPQVSAALFAAADNGCDDLALRVLDAGASLAARDREGGTALTHAARAGRTTLVRTLVGRGAEVNLRNNQGSTPLFVAVEANRADTAAALLDLGADVNLPGRAGVTPLAAAAFNINPKLVDILLAHHADPGQRDLSGKTAPIYAAARGSVPMLTRFLDAGLDVNAAYGNNLTLLMWAAGHANGVALKDGVAAVNLLLERHAAIDAVDDRGRTALMTAAAMGHEGVVNTLLRHGADRTLKDKAGKTAADLASTDEIRTRLAAAL